MLFTPYSLLLILSGVALLAIAAFTLHFKSTPAVQAHAAMMLFGAAWSFTDALAISTPSLGARVFLGNAALVFSIGTNVSALIMAVEYTGRGSWISKTNVSILVGLASFIGIIALSSPWHHLFRYGFAVDRSSGFSSLGFSIGALYPPFLIYQILILSTPIALLLFSAFRDRRVSGTAILMSVGIAALDAVEAFFGLGLSPIRGFDTGPIVLVFTGVCDILGLLNGRFRGVTFIARDLVIESLPELAIVLDEQGLVADLNEAARKALGVSEAAILGKALPEPWASRLKSLSVGDRMEVAMAVDADMRSFEVRAECIDDEGGRKRGELFILRDITETRRMEESLRASQALYLGVVEDQIDLVCRWLPDTTLTFVNEAYCEYFGLSRGESLGKRFESWISEESRMIVRGAVDELVRNHATVVREEPNFSRDGKRRWMAWIYRPVKVESGSVLEIQSVGRDITALKETQEALARANGELSDQLERNSILQERLFEQAVRDVTTGLFNRRYLEETLEREIAASERDGSSLCVIMMDIDRFKRVNDEHGHSAGDIVLASIGRILSDKTRQMDIACRYGGEEFVVIMPGATLESAIERAEELRRTIEEAEISVGKDRIALSLRITISAGVAVFPGHGQLSDDLLSAADSALYKAKESGRNNVQVYSGDASP
jgi:diguanylate cyclase (GGDEF)-like protein/PAS domain S-box-containing protein